MEKNIPLSNYSSYHIGGPAKNFIKAETVDDIVVAVQKAKKENLPFFILGGGTNILVADEGFDGVVIKPNFNKLQAQGTIITADAGVLMKDLLEFAVQHSLSGLEWAGGLPGTVGGAIRGNAGAFQGEMKDLVHEVLALDISADEPVIKKYSKEECQFDYRNSFFKKQKGESIVLSVTLYLTEGDKKEIQEAIDEKIDYRKTRHPLEYPNAGSIFKNVPVTMLTEDQKKQFETVIKTDPFPVIPVAYLISEVGLKGTKQGGAMISPKHPNFIVNVGNATANDVKELINVVKKKIKEEYDITLEEEILFL